MNNKGKKRVSFEIQMEEGNTVYVAGTFNNWNSSKHKMKYKDGFYKTSILIPRGRHEYKFIINGTWCVDPNCPNWTPNPHGSLNSVLIV